MIYKTTPRQRAIQRAHVYRIRVERFQECAHRSTSYNSNTKYYRCRDCGCTLPERALVMQPRDRSNYWLTSFGMSIGDLDRLSVVKPRNLWRDRI